MMWSFVLMYFTCELGQSVDNQFDTLSDEIYESDWYLLPQELQQMLVMVITSAQESVPIRSFGNIKCTRDSFKRVIFIRKNLFCISFLIQNYFVISDNSYRVFVFYDAPSN